MEPGAASCWCLLPPPRMGSGLSASWGSLTAHSTYRVASQPRWGLTVWERPRAPGSTTLHRTFRRHHDSLERDHRRKDKAFAPGFFDERPPTAFSCSPHPPASSFIHPSLSHGRVLGPRCGAPGGSHTLGTTAVLLGADTPHVTQTVLPPPAGISPRTDVKSRVTRCINHRRSRTQDLGENVPFLQLRGQHDPLGRSWDLAPRLPR